MENEKKDDKKGAGALFIPGGLMLGFGIGFIINNIAAGMFVGLGIGFILFALTLIFKK